MKKIILYIIVFTNFFYSKLKAQDTLQINEVVKTASLQNTFRNSNEEVIDSTLHANYKNNSIDEVLAIQTSSQIKSYGGSGNLSSISLRGIGANHVSINWNGFTINSATTGSADLSLIQTGFFENIKIIPGASSSLYGSGTFGGALELNNSTQYNNGFTISAGNEIGSFETYKYFIQTSFSNKKFHYKLSANKINAENNFPFYDKYKFNIPFEKRQHNSLNSINIIQHVSLKLQNNSRLESGVWYVLKEKEIPEIAGSYNTGNKMQNDSIFRTYMRLKKFGKKYLLTVSSAYFSEYLHYTDRTNAYDSAYYINSKISAKTFSGDVSYRYYFKSNIIFNVAGIVNRQNVLTSNYSKNKIKEVNYSLTASLKYKISGYDFKLNFRNEIIYEKIYIPLFDFGASKNIFQNKIILKTNFSNKFRKATFNEKYWQPGGNINIKNETGNNAEISLKYLLNKTIFFNATYYHSNIKDMIQWVPKNGVWTAQNNKKVKISGFETSFYKDVETKIFSHKIIASYNYTNALLTDIYSNEGFFASQKLIYAPENTAKLYIASTYKKITVSLATQYTGKQYTTQENNEDDVLSAYFISNIYTSYSTDIKQINIFFNVKFLNIFNTQYEMIKSYPASGRAVYFSIVLSYKKDNNKAKSYKF